MFFPRRTKEEAAQDEARIDAMAKEEAKAVMEKK